MKVHVFPFSLRKGTAAEKLKGHIDEHTKKERVRRLIQLSDELEDQYLKKFIGKEEDVLFETLKDGVYTGHTSNYMKVVTSDEVSLHTIEKITITELLENHTLRGSKQK